MGSKQRVFTNRTNRRIIMTEESREAVCEYIRTVNREGEGKVNKNGVSVFTMLTQGNVVLRTEDGRRATPYDICEFFGMTESMKALKKIVETVYQEVTGGGTPIMKPEQLFLDFSEESK